MKYAKPGARAIQGGRAVFPPGDSRNVELTGAMGTVRGVLYVEVKPVDCPTHREWIAMEDLEDL